MTLRPKQLEKAIDAAIDVATLCKKAQKFMRVAGCVGVVDIAMTEAKSALRKLNKAMEAAEKG